ncbi:uncharacterized protein AB675_3410 [Cyphellophora attinorum]|uniref:Transcription factor domain-containing protein n=1 Tax=Cyphellophora attinorum TaxID=1664694 RepID=A0A0N0NLS8_9EURO|nr:uncharacterized protein AB675_3410 [Phialophora attinorum]KPI39651.1 hypothetical protein AB675_3410 [Phialophora attinorum]
MDLDCSFAPNTVRNRRVELLLDRQHRNKPTQARHINHVTGSDTELRPFAQAPAGSSGTVAEREDASVLISGGTASPGGDTVLEHPTDASATGNSLDTSYSSRSAFCESDVLPWLSIFFDRLYSTLPIVNRLNLYRDIMLRRQDRDPHFAAMVLSLCALTLVQPVYRQEFQSMPARVAKAEGMLREATNHRDITFGEQISSEAVIASFFMFAALFGLGYHKAAWLRLREAIEYGKLIGLHLPETYNSLPSDEQGQRFRLLLILTVTERGYALQRNHSITFTGQYMDRIDDLYRRIDGNATIKISSILVHDSRDVAAMHGLLQLMRLCDAVDEYVIPCWNRTCAPHIETCTKLDVARVSSVYHAIAGAMHQTKAAIDHDFTDTSAHATTTNPQLNSAQWADCFVLQQWLLVRLWVCCLTHDLLDVASTLPFMKPSFVIDLANQVLAKCQQLDRSLLEVHGAGMAERLHDIAMGVVMAIEYSRGTALESSTGPGVTTLQGFFELLEQLRDGNDSIISALRDAYSSIQPIPHENG